jgi:hypothetical protein
LADGDTLSVRSGPRAVYEVVGEVQNGETLQNNGCRMNDDQRWCEIRATGSGLSGWVTGSFLTEGSAPRPAETLPGGPVGNGFPFDATGSVPCSTAAGQPSRPCPFGVVREGPGNAGVWIALGDGTERHFLFEGGVPVATNVAAELTFSKEADLFLIRVGNERYEIPEAVVNGG